MIESVKREKNSYEKTYSSGERRLHIRLNINEIGGYARDVIFANKCDTLLDMRAVYDHGFVEIYYITDGLRTLADIIDSSENIDILFYISEILHAIRNCEDYLIYCDEIVLSPDNMYCNEKDDSIKLMYIPKNEKSISIREAIVAIIDKSIYSNNVSSEQIELLSEYKKDIFHRDNYGINDLIRITEETARSRSDEENEFKDGEEYIEGQYSNNEENGCKISRIIDMGSRLKNMLTELVS